MKPIQQDYRYNLFVMFNELKNEFIMILKSIISFALKQLVLMHKGSIMVKFKSTLVLSIMTAAPVGLFETLSNWLIDNSAYIGFVLFAIVVDHILGSAVHLWVKRDFSFKKNIIGIFVKLGLVFTVGVLFEGFQYIYPEDNVITDYLSLITRLMVFLYPAGSAFMNCAILTKGKFPPIGWINKISKFNQNLNVSEFKTDGEKSENYD